MQSLLYIVIAVLIVVRSAAQTGVSIHPTGAPPDPSAILDVSSSTQGQLMPRLTNAQRDAMVNPAQGLVIFNTSSECFNVYKSTGWFEWCGSCVPPAAPVAGSHTTTLNQIIWNWNAVPGATGYKWNSSNDYNSATDLSSSTSYSQNALNCGTSTTSYVWAYNACGGNAVTTLNASTASCCSSPNNWSQKTDFGGTSRYAAVGFSIGTKAYIGTGTTGSTYYQDFWEWDQATNAWTQKASLSGAGRHSAVGFAIGTKGYIGTGFTSSGRVQDFWEWDQATNTWLQKTSFGGTARSGAVGFSIGTKGYIGTGYDNDRTKDFWEWDQATDTWTQKTDFGGDPRTEAAGFSIGNKGYIGTGQGNQYYQDLWEWNQATNTWNQKAAFPGSARFAATAFSIGTKGYIGTGYTGSSMLADFWQWDQAGNAWTVNSSFPSARWECVGFAIGSSGYIGTGAISGFQSGNRKDLWEWCE